MGWQIIHNLGTGDVIDVGETFFGFSGQRSIAMAMMRMMGLGRCRRGSVFCMERAHA